LPIQPQVTVILCRLEEPAHISANNIECLLPESVLTQFVSPDDEQDVLETCTVINKNKYIEKNCASRWSFTKNAVYVFKYWYSLKMEIYIIAETRESVFCSSVSAICWK
jgi:hypothetical protein